jgi:hypothetical protein
MITGLCRNLQMFDISDCTQVKTPGRTRSFVLRHNKNQYSPWKYFLFFVAMYSIIAAQASTSLSGMASKQQQPPPSASSQGPVIGLSVAGRLKCYLWGPSEDDVNSENPPLTPLFSPNGNLDETNQEPGSIPTASSGTKRHPFSLYAIADYHFQKERWYGVKKAGLLFRQRLCPVQSLGSLPERPASILYGIGQRPSNLDVTVDHTFPTRSEGCKGADSAEICLTWDGNRDSVLQNFNSNHVAPWIKVGVHQSQREPSGTFGFSLPFSPQFNLQWMFHWATGRNVAGSSSVTRKTVRSPIGNSPDYDWWVPDIKLDPFGFLSSENRFFKSNHMEHYSMDVKFKVSTKAPSLLFGSVVGDDGPQAIWLRTECSVWDERMKHPNAATARFETALFPSNGWWQSLKDTSSFTLILDQYHSIDHDIKV